MCQKPFIDAAQFKTGNDQCEQLDIGQVSEHAAPGNHTPSWETAACGGCYDMAGAINNAYHKTMHYAHICFDGRVFIAPYDPDDAGHVDH